MTFELAEGCAVLVMGPPCDDLEWRAYISAINGLQTHVDRQTRPVLLQVLRHGMTMPSALVRREMAQLRGRIRADAVNAVVAEDAAIRLVQTALDWIRRPHYASSNHPDFAAAHAHIEKTLRHPLPVLARLYSEANKKYKAG